MLVVFCCFVVLLTFTEWSPGWPWTWIYSASVVGSLLSVGITGLCPSAWLMYLLRKTSHCFLYLTWLFWVVMSDIIVIDQPLKKRLWPLLTPAPVFYLLTLYAYPVCVISVSMLDVIVFDTYLMVIQKQNFFLNFKQEYSVTCLKSLPKKRRAFGTNASLI